MSQSAPLSVQLYSLREALAQGVEPVLEQIAATGYVGVEPYSGLDFEKAAPLVKSLGLQVASMHAPLPVGDDKNKVLEMAQAYGVNYIVAPYLPPEHFTQADAIKAVAHTLNEANTNASAAGYKFAYHNHEFEFVMVDGQVAFDLLLAELEPTVYLEVDTYWVKVGRQDPIQLIQKLGARAPLLHIKDGPADPANRDAFMTAVGEGTMDVPGIVQAGAPHSEWLIVELDHCATDMQEAVTKSYTYMTQKGLAHGR